MKIVIVGGHGKIALTLGSRLVRDGHAVRGLVRKQSQFGALRERGMEPVALDLESSDELALGEAFAHTDLVVFAAGSGGGSVARTYAVDRDASIRAARAATNVGVGRYVLISTVNSGNPEGLGAPRDYYIAKGEADIELQTLSIGWTIVRPGPLSDTPGTGLVQVHTPESADGNAIPREDVAAVLAAVIDQPTAATGKVFTVFGGGTRIQDAIAGLP